MIQHVMLLGGPGDGRVVEFDVNQDVPVESEPLFEKDPDPFTSQYELRRVYTPDWIPSGDQWIRIPHWGQTVFVHTCVNLDTVSEADIVRAIMTAWRAKHRKESGRIRLPSRFAALSEEMLR